MADVKTRKLKIAIFTDVFLEVAGGIPSSIQAQKDILKEQLAYFQTCLAQAGPMLFHHHAKEQ